MIYFWIWLWPLLLSVIAYRVKGRIGRTLFGGMCAGLVVFAIYGSWRTANPVAVFHSSGHSVWAPDSWISQIQASIDGNGCGGAGGRGQRRSSALHEVTELLGVNRIEVPLELGVRTVTLTNHEGRTARIRLATHEAP